MSPTRRYDVGLGVAALLIACGVALLRMGTYGWTLFALLPFLFGVLASWVFRPPTAGRAAAIGAVTAMASACSLLIGGLEGSICILMSLPLVAPWEHSAVGWPTEPSLEGKPRATSPCCSCCPPPPLRGTSRLRRPSLKCGLQSPLRPRPSRSGNTCWPFRSCLSRRSGTSAQDWLTQCGRALRVRPRRDTVLRILHRPLRGAD